jgi:predicted regulator of Ras-like GTPase activity (Roadblock/LC7/MglB family)
MQMPTERPSTRSSTGLPELSTQQTAPIDEVAMTAVSHQASAAAQQFNWLLSQFASKTPAVLDAIAVSADGLLMAMSDQLRREDADRIAAITSALISLSNGAGKVHDMGLPGRVIIELDKGYLLVTTISIGSALGVFTSKAANLGTLAYEMATFANRAGEVLTPGLIEELKATVGY